MSREAPRSSFSVLGEIALWIALPTIAVLGYWAMLLRAMGVAGCEGACDMDLIDWAYGAVPWGIGAAFTVAIVGAVVLVLMRQRTAWAAGAGVVVLLASFVVTGSVVGEGFAPMHERNERSAREAASPPPPLPPVAPIGAWGTAGQGQAHITFSADGTLAGSDGCNDLEGIWMQGADGEISIDKTDVTFLACDGLDTWFSYGESAVIADGFLYVKNSDGSVIGGFDRAE
ncbi:hypothetical protein FHX48_002322 [Microbacterium halimionae]|uniref:DUF306 domain-containing protein n=1 Tax=Microbacterium halimionae TaxID=1526413 RepID=A0A7W3JQM9_9MICO|nr:META domain-containing protein [Microbacterium halimionae]MBA8817224.1 hypothetical protein [Microbacterium halimionae]NII94674.1 hypothetical protein [Microbacterium halimionae]